MLRSISTARMHPVERYAAAFAVTILSLGAGAAASLGPRFALAAVALGLVVAILAVALPGARLTYVLGDRAIYAGGTPLLFADMTDTRVAPLSGTFLLFGLTLPGYWRGQAWSRQLGRFRILGSTGLGRGVLISMADGSRWMLTPASPDDLVVRLQVHRYAAQRATMPKRPKLH